RPNPKHRSSEESPIPRQAHSGKNGMNDLLDVLAVLLDKFWARKIQLLRPNDAYLLILDKRFYNTHNQHRATQYRLQQHVSPGIRFGYTFLCVDLTDRRVLDQPFYFQHRFQKWADISPAVDGREQFSSRKRLQHQRVDRIGQFSSGGHKKIE